MPKTVKSQAIVDFASAIPKKRGILTRWWVLREVAVAKEIREQWVMKFDGSSTAHSRGMGIVLYHKKDEAATLSFKLEFPCSNNTVEYEAHLIGLAMMLEMGVKHLKVMDDSNLVIYQTKGSFSLKESNLVPYKTMA